MTVKSKEEAWRIAKLIFPGDFMMDMQSSLNSGYPIFKSCDVEEFEQDTPRICDLGCRLEIVLKNDDVNIWIEDPADGKTITVGHIKDALHLPSITLQHIEEIEYNHVIGYRFCVDDVNFSTATQCVVIVVNDGTSATFPVDKIAYIR